MPTFADIKQIVIPEGNVIAIDDENNVRIWQAAIDAIVNGVSPLILPSAIRAAIGYLKQKGVCEQNGTPTPSVPVDIFCNNGAIKYGVVGKNWFYVDGSVASTFINDEGVTRGSSGWMLSDYIPVKPNTQYYFNPNSTAGSTAKHVYYTANKTFIDIVQSGPSTFTTPANCAFMRFSYRVESTNIQLEFGDIATTYEAYKGRGIYIDGTPEILSVGGINLFDKNSLNSGNYYVNSSGNIANAASNACIYFRCKPNTTYYFKHTQVVGGLRAFTVSVEDWAVGSPANPMVGSVTDAANTVMSITTEADAKWIFFLYGRSSGTTATFEEQADDFMVSTYSIDANTPYQPFSDTQIANAENLFSLGNFADEQDIISGVVRRKIGIKIFDGTEDWVGQPTYFRLDGEFDDGIDFSSDNPPIYCTHFVGRESRTTTTNMNNGEIKLGYSTTYPRRLYLKYSNLTSANELKAWLAEQYAAGTPVIVVYILEQEIIEQVTPQPLNTVNGDNIVNVVSEVSNIPLEVKYKRN